MKVLRHYFSSGKHRIGVEPNSHVQPHFRGDPLTGAPKCLLNNHAPALGGSSEVGGNLRQRGTKSISHDTKKEDSRVSVRPDGLRSQKAIGGGN